MRTLIEAEFSNAFDVPPPVVVLVGLVAAARTGGNIGIERGGHTDGAGLRIRILVSLASCRSALIVVEVMADPTGKGSGSLRLIWAVTTGAAVLDPASVLTSGRKVKRLTNGAPA